MQDLILDLDRTAALVDVGAMQVLGELTLPAEPRGIVLLVNGTRARWQAPRAGALAESLAHDGVGTLICDLFSRDEEAVDRITRHLRFDARALAERVTAVVRWLRRQQRFAGLPIGLLGTGIGAAAALIAASTSHDIAAVVAHAGRTELPRQTLHGVRCPTLFIAGAADSDVIVSNCRAVRQMREITATHIVRWAGHLDEPSVQHHVAEVTSSWFAAHLGPGERVRSLVPTRTTP